jgi:hypothetical protein
LVEEDGIAWFYQMILRIAFLNNDADLVKTFMLLKTSACGIDAAGKLTGNMNNFSLCFQQPKLLQCATANMLFVKQTAVCTQKPIPVFS